MQAAQNQVIYYYSYFKIFNDQILQDVLWCQSFLPNLESTISNYLREIRILANSEWLNKAAQAAYIINDRRDKQYLQTEYIIDILVYSWIQLKNSFGLKQIPVSETIFISFEAIVINKLSGAVLSISLFMIYIYRSSHYKRPFSIIFLLRCQCEQLFIGNCDESAITIYSKVLVYIDSFYQRKVDFQCLSIYITTPQVKATYSLQDEKAQQLAINQIRSLSDLRNDLAGQQQVKQIISQKKHEVLLDIIRQQYQPQTSSNAWQCLRQFIVIVWELKYAQNDELKKLLEDHENVRMMKPVQEFYRDALQVWIIENVKGKTPDYISFKSRVKHYYSKQWKDEWSLALFQIFRFLNQISTTTVIAAHGNNQIQMFIWVLQTLSIWMEDKWKQCVVNTFKCSN